MNEVLKNKWCDRYFQLGQGLKVGISWRGGDPGLTHQLRSIPLSQWQALLSVPGIHFINLQYGDTQQDLYHITQDLEVSIHDWQDSDPLTDMDDFFAKVSALDLVISIDNTTVHTAGALAVPCWTLLSKTADWRWFENERHSIWYSNMLLYRQQQLLEWNPVLEQITDDLNNLVQNTETRREATGSITMKSSTLHASTCVTKEETYWDTPIFVVGVPRSGTSLTSGIMQLSGAWLGNTLQPSSENPKGFFEHCHLRQLNKTILSHLGFDPLGVRTLPPLNDLPKATGLREEVFKIITAENYDGTQPWLFKSVKMTLLWPMWLEAFPSAKWLIIRRDREDIVSSCMNTSFMKQHGFPASYRHDWVNAYLERIEALKCQAQWWREIWPSHLIGHKLTLLENTVKELNLDWNEQVVKDFIQPDYWHGKKAEKTAMQ